ncbi:MAG TPA: M23 family metallopeptidase [Pilimelia sp.]|nr:M23 family metallopeptidase [Pilimelia sp.]
MGRVIACAAGVVLAVVVLVAGATAGVLGAVTGAVGPGAGCLPATPSPGPPVTAGAVGCDPQEVSAQGWARPVPGPVGSGFRTGDRPDHDGVDIAAPRGTPVRAASAGVVVTVMCNVDGSADPPDRRPSACDRDGSPDVGGCGWYAEIRHRGGIVSRYCHMSRAPVVRVGQPVSAGQPIGMVGTSGNSSGPHLHFEIHTGYPAHSGNAIDAAAFMTAHGVPM